VELHTYLTFVIASIILCLTPGPDVIFILSRSVANGKKAGLYAVFGVIAGSYIHLAAAVLGLSAIIATSALAFTVIKILGAMYLLYLGASILFSKTRPIDFQSRGMQNNSNLSIFWQGFLSDVLNPKVALFYISILPQFIDPHANNYTVQLLILGVTLNTIGFLISLVWVHSASSLTQTLRESAKISYWLNKSLGGLFLLLGIKLATDRM
jgi:threonine/homoserine/homoserine lactone efflux protein